MHNAAPRHQVVGRILISVRKILTRAQKKRKRRRSGRRPAEAPAGLGRRRGATERGGRGGGGAVALTTGGAVARGQVGPLPTANASPDIARWRRGGVLDVGGGVPAVRCRVEGRKEQCVPIGYPSGGICCHAGLPSSRCKIRGAHKIKVK